MPEGVPKTMQEKFEDDPFFREDERTNHSDSIERVDEVGEPDFLPDEAPPTPEELQRERNKHHVAELLRKLKQDEETTVEAETDEARIARIKHDMLNRFGKDALEPTLPPEQE